MLSQAKDPLKNVPIRSSMAVGREEDDARVGVADAELDPALVAHRLVGDDLEPELLRVEGERRVLVARGDPGELQMRNHAADRTRSGAGKSSENRQLASSIAIVVKSRAR